MSTTTIQHDGRTIGYATGPQRDGTYSLTTDNGMDLVAVGTSIEDAAAVLVAHREWRMSR